MKLFIESSDGIDRLCRSISEVPISQNDLLDRLEREIFPLLDFNSWVSHLMSNIPEAHAVTFGAVASALGTVKASRSVGSWSVDPDNISHRLVYSDGRVPVPSITELSSEIDLELRGKDLYVPERSMIEEIVLENPPFNSLRDLQKKSSALISDEKSSFKRIAGIDISSKGDHHFCAVCSMDILGKNIVKICHKGMPGIPYVSGFLFFREAPIILPTLKTGLNTGLIDERTLIVMDGNGYLHPERMGIACQIGAVTGLMTCGVAKKLIIGRIGDWVNVNSKEEIAVVQDGGEIIGYASRHGGGRPIFISKGNRTDLKEVAEVLISMKKGRLPDPIKASHNEANRCRRSESPSCNLQVLPLPLHEGIDR